MSGHLDGPPPGPPDPPYIPGDMGAPSPEEFARRRASSEPRPENPYRTLHARMSPPGAAWDEGWAAREAATCPDCGGGHCSEPCGEPAAALPDERLREAVAALPQYVITIQDREGYTYERGCAGQPMNYTGVMLADVEALIGELKDGAPAAREATDELKDALRAIASFDAAGDARFDYLDVIRVKEIARLALAAADREAPDEETPDA